MDREAAEDYLGAHRAKTTPAARASLSYWLKRQVIGSDTLRVTNDLVLAAISRKLPLPNPSQLATNIVRYIGDATADSGQALDVFPDDFRTVVGAINRRVALETLGELVERGLIRSLYAEDSSGIIAQDAKLTLAGWDMYEREQQGEIQGKYGFLALKFGDETLRSFVRSHVKPAVSELGFELRDMQDNARAGIIDNLMRIDIRDAAFVIADLTHDNYGAYWEAGYAEGLGKTVLYICEKSKFERLKTHFDTNHSTTVLWDIDQPDAFKDNLIATLRRSLPF